MRCLDECPFPTLADAYEISTRFYAVTVRRAFVHNTGHTLYGSESNRLMLPSHCQIRHFPAGGSCSPLVYANYLLVLVQQCRQPIRFLYSCVKLAILPRKIIGLPLYRRNAHGANELHLGARGAALGC